MSLPLQPVRVRLLRQGAAREPLDALSNLGVSLTAANDETSAANPMPRSRKHLLQILQLAHGGSTQREALDSTLSELVRTVTDLERGSERNRRLFLTAVLAGDDACAASLVRSGAAAKLCSLSTSSSRSSLSQTEVQWVFVALAEFAAQPSRGVPCLLEAGVLRNVAELLGNVNGAAEALTSEARLALVGVWYAAIAVLANLALESQGAEAVLRSGMLPYLVSRLR